MRLEIAPNTPCGFCGKLLMVSLTGQLLHIDWTPICDSWHLPAEPQKEGE